jgi:hypothetical protein
LDLQRKLTGSKFLMNADFVCDKATMLSERQFLFDQRITVTTILIAGR